MSNAIEPSVSRYGHMHDVVYRRLRNQGRSGWDTDDTYAEMLDIVRPVLERERARGSQDLRVLELGCGAGELAIALVRDGYAVTAVDASSVAIEWAREKAAAQGTGIEFLVDDVTELPRCKPQGFDVAIDAHCLHCIVGNDRHRALTSIQRVLRSTGVLVVMTMCGEVTSPKVRAALASDGKTQLHNGIPVRYIGPAHELLQELVLAGFAVESHEVKPRESIEAQDLLVAIARRA